MNWSLIFMTLVAAALVLRLFFGGDKCNMSVRGLTKIFHRSSAKNDLKISTKANVSGIVFGKKAGLYVTSPPEAEGHTLVLGGSGVGKTTALLIPTLNAWGNSNSSFVIDISDDIAKNVNMTNKLIFDPDNINTLPYDIFAPIDTITDKGDKIEALQKMGTFLRPLTYSDIKSGGGKFYAEGAQNILGAVLIAGYFYDKDFCTICKWLCSSTDKQIISDIKNIGEETAITLINPYSNESDNNAVGCFNEARKAVKLFATNHHIMNSVRRSAHGEKAFSPDQIEKYNCFIIIRQERLELYKPLTQIIVAQTLDYFMSRPLNYKKQLLFALDELRSLGKLELSEALRTYRKRGIRIFCLTQSLADIDIVYGEEERVSMINNFSYKVILRADDPANQKYFADLIGKDKNRFDGFMREEYNIKPERLRLLHNKLILIHPDGYMKLKKNFYYKSSRLSFNPFDRLI